MILTEPVNVDFVIPFLEQDEDTEGSEALKLDSIIDDLQSTPVEVTVKTG